jgi:hypothetical protein
MPFVSRAQWRQCFAAARNGKRKMSECKEFARKSKSYRRLPERKAKKTNIIRRAIRSSRR